MVAFCLPQLLFLFIGCCFRGEIKVYIKKKSWKKEKKTTFWCRKHALIKNDIVIPVSFIALPE